MKLNEHRTRGERQVILLHSDVHQAVRREPLITLGSLGDGEQQMQNFMSPVMRAIAAVHIYFFMVN